MDEIISGCVFSKIGYCAKLVGAKAALLRERFELFGPVLSNAKSCDVVS